MPNQAPPASGASTTLCISTAAAPGPSTPPTRSGGMRRASTRDDRTGVRTALPASRLTPVHTAPSDSWADCTGKQSHHQRLSYFDNFVDQVTSSSDVPGAAPTDDFSVSTVQAARGALPLAGAGRNRPLVLFAEKHRATTVHSASRLKAARVASPPSAERHLVSRSHRLPSKTSTSPLLPRVVAVTLFAILLSRGTRVVGVSTTTQLSARKTRGERRVTESGGWRIAAVTARRG